MTHPIPKRPNGTLRRHRTKGFEHTINGLLTKRTHLIESVKQAREVLQSVEDDLAALDRVLALVGYTDDPDDVMPSRTNRRIFVAGEIARSCLKELSKGGQKTSRELSLLLLGQKGLDLSDKDLVNGVTSRVSNALKKEVKAGRVKKVGAGPAKWEIA